MNMSSKIGVLFFVVIIVFVYNVNACVVDQPTADIISTPDTPQVGETVIFNGTGSFDPTDGDVTRYEWTFPPEAYYISGANTAYAKCKFSPADDVNGYIVKLKVYDSEGYSDEETETILVSEASGLWYVKENGNDDNDGQSWPTAFATIQMGIDTAVSNNGEAVYVDEGTYYENINFRGKNIIVRSTDPDDSAVVANTIIDAGGVGTAVSFGGSEDYTCQLKGFTIRGGGDSYGLLAHWEFENDYTDSAGDNDGTAGGSPSFEDTEAAVGSYSLDLDGTEDYVTISGYKGIPGRQARTCAAWIRTEATDSASEMDILYWGENKGGERWRISLYPVNNEAYLKVDVLYGRKFGATNVADGQWHHVAVTWENDGTPDITDAKLYVDGVLETETFDSSYDINTGTSADANDVIIGSSIEGDYFDGLIDDVQIYGRALDGVEVSELALNFDPGSHWKFEEDDPNDFAGDNEATVNGATYSTSVYQVGSASLAFDDANDYVEIADYKGSTGSRSRSATAWIKTATAGGGITGWGSFGGPNGTAWGLYVDDGTIGSGGEICLTVGGDYIIGDDPVDANDWHHVAVVLEDDSSAVVSEIKLYVDGREQITTCGVGTTAINTYSNNDVTIGCTDTTVGDYFSGYIDDVRIYNRALSGLEVLELAETAEVADGVFVLGAHWKLDEESGTTADDSGSGDHDGTLTNMNGDEWTAGVLGNALAFDGSEDEDYVTADGTSGSAYTGILGTSSRTSCAWVKVPPDSGGGDLITWGYNVNGQKWRFRARSKTPGIVLGVEVLGGNTYGSTDIADGRWHHIAAVLEDDGSPDANEIKLYVDGNDETISSYVSNSINTSDNGGAIKVRLGAYDYSPHYFDGLIDDARVYGIALNASQLKEMAAERPYLEAHWPFDDGTGQSTAKNKDASGEDTGYYDGALTDMDPNNDWVDGIFGSALDFDGTDEYVEITGYKGITGSAPRTCTAWIKMTPDTGTATLMHWGTNVAGGRWTIRVNSDGHLRLEVGGNAIDGNMTEVDDGSWHHVAVVSDGTDLAGVLLYVDGNPETFAAPSTNPTINTQPAADVIISSPGISFEGLMDDVRIYNIALTPKEIEQLFLAHGGGINGKGTEAEIRNCVIKDNYSDYDGGGIFDFDGTISRCQILNNEAGQDGGGLADCDGTVINTIIASNNAIGDGGGVDNSAADILNCTIADNTATTTAGLKDCSGTIKNSIIWHIGTGNDLSNTSVTYGCVEDGAAGTGNISSTPNFTNASAGDYHLLTTSLCIDGGDPDSEYLYELSPLGSRINMGAYGNTSEAAETVDTDYDGMPDIWETAMGVSDAALDDDEDGLTNLQEYLCGTDPNGTTNDADADADGDGMSNLVECENGLDPLTSNAGEQITIYEYDDAGQTTRSRNLEVVNDTLYMTESRTDYDILGRRKVARRVATPIISGEEGGPDDGDDMITLYGYDVQGNVVTTVQKGYDEGTPNESLTSDQTGDIVTENTYDKFGRIETVTNGEDETTTYAYLNGQLQTVTNNDSKVVATNHYDDAGRLEKVVDAESHYRTMEYDSFGRAIKEIAWEEAGETDTALMQRRSVYDGVGRVVTQAIMATAGTGDPVDPNTDMVTTYAYDDSEGTYPGMLASQTRYYAWDSVSETSSTATTTFDYDDLGRRIKTTDPDSNETIIEYDEMGRVTRRQQIDDHPLGGESDLIQTTDYEYDDQGRLTKLKNAVVADPDSQDDNDWMITTYEYALSMRIKETKPNDIETTYEYNAWGHRVKTVADANYVSHTGEKQTTEWGFNRLGRQISIKGYTGAGTGGTAQTTTYDYDDAGRVLTITYPDTKTIAYTYNAGNKVAARRDQRYSSGKYETVYTYDDNYNLLAKDVTDADNVDWDETFTFDGLNRMLTADKTKDAADISHVVFAYNDIGRITDFDQTHFGGTERTIDYEYDQAGLLESTDYPDGSTTIDRSNDWRGSIDTLTRDPDGTPETLAAYEYLGARVAQRSYSTPSIDYQPTYDNLGRITEMDYGESIVNFDYDYVANENNIERKTFDHRDGDPYNQYTYDDLDRLTAVTYHDFDTEAFNMDALGNRTGDQTLRDDGTVDFTVVSATNRYSSVGGNSISHDDAGNMTVDKDGYQYTYDYENRVVRIEDVNDVEVATHDYDALGRRIRVIDKSAAPDVTTLYYYNPDWQVLAEYNGAGAQQRYYVYGNYIDEPLIMHRESDSEDYYYAQDHLYSVAAIIDDGGSVVERYEYDAYGTVHIMDVGYNTRTVSSYGNPYTFTGRRLDVLDSSNLELMHYRHRYYDNYTARFYQHDPLGVDPGNMRFNTFDILTQYQDSLNLYRSFVSCPIGRKDPLGLTSIEEYHNPGDTGHWGIHVDGRDYDFGPIGPPLDDWGTHRGQAPWYGTMDNKSVLATTYELKLQKKGRMHNGPNAGKRCCKLTLRNAGICIKYVAVMWDGDLYLNFTHHCRSFVNHAKMGCCLKRK